MKQKLFLTTLCAAILILVAGLLAWHNLRPSSEDHAGQDQRITTPKARPALSDRNSSRFTPEAPTPSDESKPNGPVIKEEILESVHQASITYDPKELPVIQKYLLDADPEIREAARNAMIVLGDASAGPMLRDASKLAPTPHEAVAMLEAADYVELPSGTLNLKKRAMTKPKRSSSRSKPQGEQAPE